MLLKLCLCLPVALAAASSLQHESAKLIASEPTTNARFGSSVTARGPDSVLVGSPYDVTGGSVYELLRSESGQWTHFAKLNSYDTKEGDAFGSSVAVSGNYAVVGAPFHAGGGAAFVFERTSQSTEWSQIALLTPSVNSSQFGFRVAIKDGVIAVGAPYSRGFFGLAFVYELQEGVWRETSVLSPSDVAPMATFGVSVAVSHDGVFVGSGTNLQQTKADRGYQGLVYLFSKNAAGVWQQSLEFTASDGAKSDFYGTSIAVSGDGVRLVVGAGGVTTTAADWTGAAYIYTKTNGKWKETVKMSPNPADIFVSAQSYYYFGNSVSISDDGNVVAVGAYGDKPSVNSADYFGCVYVYRLDVDGAAVEVYKGIAANGRSYDRLGSYAVAVIDGVVLAGADGSDDNGLSMNGAVYVFDLQ